MAFAGSDPSVVRSIRQRYLLNTWLRAAARHRPLPLLHDFQPDRVADELADMMGFDVVGQGDEARFRITQEGARLTAIYGNEHVEPSKRTNRFLDEAIGPARYANVMTLYRTCLAHKRPAYSISMVQDEDGKDVSYERLLLPFGGGEAVEQIVGSYKSISIEGGFKINNLMGLQPKALPVTLVSAVIDRDAASARANPSASDEVVELD
ncbi:PAS domain-containing protein [Afipia sp. GAS231]|uniref:PAS domain-containing protein n=1 Tax=Afipia sp. GAS231 TaxID=1882747 RepID=UPI00087DB297|nr:PAS domain-containing protein [Afipia sp. GAS231]SDP38647.1 PAS domain-containing protein [Afipia sp. GAS231]